MNSLEVIQICISPSWGGLEMVAFETAILLQTQKVSCTTVAIAKSPLANKLKSSGMPVLEVQSGAIYFLQTVFKIRKLLKSFPVQSVLVQTLHHLFIARVSLLGFTEVSVVGFSHTFVNIFKKDIYHRWIYARLNTLVALTKTHKENLTTHLPVSENIFEIIPNSVDPTVFTPQKRNPSFRESFQSTEKDVLIGLVGRLDKAKGQSLIIKAASIIKDKGQNNFKILLVGEETLNEPGILKSLKELTQDLKLEDHIFFTGYQSNIPEIMASLDVTVMASDAETFGRVIIESMASKTAVIASRAGGVIDIIDDEINGLLFTPGNEKDLARQLERLITDQTTRERLAQAALEKVSAYYDRRLIGKKIISIVAANFKNQSKSLKL